MTRTSPRGAIPLALLCISLASGAAAAPERLRLLPGSVALDDDSGAEGTVGRAHGLSYEVVQGYAVAEGDMVLGRVDASGRLEVPIQRRGLAQSGRLDRWPDGIVPYRLGPRMTEIQTRNVLGAIDKLNARTRIELIPLDDPAASGYTDYVQFTASEGCASFVGRQMDRDVQMLWVGDACSVGSVMHEIAHAIGLFHEHTRPDRDNYVSVVWDRIESGKAFNFEIVENGVQTHGEYDYGSIMHYGESFFSRDGKATIVTPTNVQIGQRLALSADDVRSIDTMYATDLALDVNLHESERGVEIDVSVTNIGDLGARLLVLRLRGDEGVDWRSISVDSGWDCLADETELRCERPRLIEQSSSRFTVLAAAGGIDEDSLTARLESRTLDLDPSNNGFDDAVFDERDPDDERTARTLTGERAAARADADVPTTANPPALGAAADNDEAPTGKLPSADDSGGGGGGGGGPLALLAAALLLAIRRHESG